MDILPNIEEPVLAFVPKEGFQSARYYNGSKSWRSIVTKKTIKPTQWLRKL